MGKCKTALSYTRYIDSERIRSDPRGKHLSIQLITVKGQKKRSRYEDMVVRSLSALQHDAA